MTSPDMMVYPEMLLERTDGVEEHFPLLFYPSESATSVIKSESLKRPGSVPAAVPASCCSSLFLTLSFLFLE